MATTYWAFPPQAFMAFDSNGDPVAAAEAKIFEAGTSTPLTVYTDTALTTPHAVPQIADANGVFSPIYISGPDEIKIEIRTTGNGSLLPGFPVDNITGTPVGGLAAAGIVFVPTATLAAVDVQTALTTLDTLTQRTRNRLIEVETAGSSNAYTLNAIGTITAYVDGDIFVLRADRNNGGAATLNVDSVGAKNWKRHDGTSYAAYAAGEIRDGGHYLVEYDSGADEFHTLFERRRPATQAEAEAGTAVAVDMDALRVRQAILNVGSWALVSKFYDFGTDGVLASVETPTFVDGFEYAIEIVELSHNDGGSQSWRIDLFGETDAAYLGASPISSSANSSNLLKARIGIPNPREVLNIQAVLGVISVTGLSIQSAGKPFFFSTAQKVTKARITFSAGSIDAGIMRLFKRKS